MRCAMPRHGSLVAGEGTRSGQTSLGPDLEEQKNRSNFGAEIEQIPPGQWIDVGNGLSFWGTKIEPYHELTWV